MTQKHNDVIHAALLESAATLTSAYYAGVVRTAMLHPDHETTRKEEVAGVFAEMLEKVERAYDAHLAKHNEK